MKSISISVITLLLCLFTLNASAQHQRVCGHDAVLDYARSATPDFDQQYNQIFEQAKTWAAENINNREDDTVYTIQVVFHILYEEDDPYQYLSDELIQSQLAALNRDFNKRNADTVETREVFQALAGNAKINFVLAKKISDQCRNAIIRKAWTAPDFVLPIYGDFLIKDNFWGGSSAWNTAKYLNIWVCDLNKNSEPGGGFLGGYAFLPGLVNAGLPLPKRHDGVVIDFRFFGQDNPYILEVEPGFGNYTRGRTTVHEVGHWLGLRHIWGDLGTLLPDQGCQADDGIDDTPNAAQPYAAHGFCEDTIVNSCDEGAGDLPDMFENYMDYSTDECNSMFTIGQSDVMRFTLTDFRAGTQFEYDMPTTERIEASVNEGESIDLCFELEDCFGYSTITTSFLGDDSTYTSPIGEARLIANETCFKYTAGDYDPDNNVDEFELFMVDNHFLQFDQTDIVITVNEVVATGIDLVSSTDNDIELFPNPAPGIFTVSFNGLQKDTEVNIFNTLGSLVLQRTVSAGTSNEMFDLKNYATGAYVIRFQSGDEMTFEKVVLE